MDIGGATYVSVGRSCKSGSLVLCVVNVLEGCVVWLAGCVVSFAGCV